MAGSVFVATSFPGIWLSVVDAKRVGCVLSADFDSVGTGVLCSGCQRLFFATKRGVRNVFLLNLVKEKKKKKKKTIVASKVQECNRRQFSCWCTSLDQSGHFAKARPDTAWNVKKLKPLITLSSQK